MEEVDDVLLCRENQTCLFEELGHYSTSEDDDRFVEILLEREITGFGIKETDSLEFNDTIKFARLEALQWILKTRAELGFRYETAYVSLSYLDRFLSSRIINWNETLWAWKLLAVACLSVAVKVEETVAPPLSEFRFENYNFESSVIKRMELLVLNTLEWKMNSVTPFDFIHYLASKLCTESETPPIHISSTSVDIIFSFFREERLMNHRPSAVAAAAFLMGLDQRLTRKSLELKMNSISSFKAVPFEDVVECYNSMKNMKVERHEEMPKLEKSPPNHVTPRDSVESPSVTATVSCKKRRLKF